MLDETARIPGVSAAAGLYNDLVTIGGDSTYVTATEDLAVLGRAYGTTAPTLRDDQIAVSAPATAA